MCERGVVLRLFTKTVGGFLKGKGTYTIRILASWMELDFGRGFFIIIAAGTGQLCWFRAGRIHLGVGHLGL